jgi:cytochrome P450
MRSYPPGPHDRFCGLTFYRSLNSDPLGFAANVARKYGDFTYVRVGWVNLYFVNRPELIREVLSTKAKCFRKLGRQMRALRKIEGDGLVASDGETWARHRPVVQGSFHARHFRRYADVIVEYTRRRLEGWVPGSTFDMAAEMNELALEIIAKLVFDVDVSGDAVRLRDAVHVFRNDMQREVSLPVVLPDWLPLPSKIRQRRAVRIVDDLIWQQIRERRTAGVEKNDILAQMLAAAAAVHPGSPISDAEIRDEAATLFVAGHDTTSAALAWFWYLLSRYPEAERRVLAEVDSVLGDRPATSEDVPRLRYLEMVIRESMRLYPVAGFLFGREAIEDVELAGCTLRRGSWVFIAPYIVHRDERLFPDPEVFDPERFAPGRIDEIPPYAFIPFGGGPRICIGNSLAMTQIALLTATVLQRFRVALDQEQPEMELEIVLRPKGALRMRPLQRLKHGSLTLAG